MGFDITGIGSIADCAKEVVGVVKRFLPAAKMSEAEQAQATLAVQEMIGRREDAVIEAKTAITVAELQQKDKFTKRARPTVVYSGLLFIALVHVILPTALRIIFFWKFDTLTVDQMTQLTGLLALELPGEFWVAWGGIVATWCVARTVEKRGATGKLGAIAGLITGGK